MTTSEITTGPRDLLRLSDLNREQLEHLLDLAAEMKAAPHGWREAQPGKVLACYFSKPSTRTRVSLEAAAYRLGMLPIMLRPDELQLGRGEPITDTGRVLAGYVDAIAIRTFAQSDVDVLAAAAGVPVVNALTDLHHPCQALADLLTLREHYGRLEGLKLAYVGDGNNVLNSLLEAASLAGMELIAATPAGYRPDEGIFAGAQYNASLHGHSVRVVTDPFEAVDGAHAVYTDVWVSMGDEAERQQRLDALSGFQVTPELMFNARPDAAFMHCLPAHRGQEVSGDVIDGPQSVVFQQAANRLPTEQALIHTLIEGWR
jgi:ornithine carbamoyltransferase